MRSGNDIIGRTIRSDSEVAGGWGDDILIILRSLEYPGRLILVAVHLLYAAYFKTEFDHSLSALCSNRCPEQNVHVTSVVCLPHGLGHPAVCVFVLLVVCLPNGLGHPAVLLKTSKLHYG